MSILLPLTLLVAAPAAPLPPQDPRPAVQVDTNSTGTGLGPSIATAGELSVAAWNDGGTGGSNTVSVALSDGRGLTWSAPIRVDADATGARKFTQFDSVAVIGDSIYVVWSDERAGSSNDELWFNRSHDGGATWQGEVLLDKAYASGTGAVRDWNLVATRDAGVDHLYVLFTVDPTTTANEELYLLASHDGGLPFRLNVAAPSPVSMAALLNAADLPWTWHAAPP